MERRVWILLAAVVAAAAADAILWGVAVGRLTSGFDAWASRGRAAGWTIVSGTPAAGGWPWSARLDIAGLSVSGGKAVLPGGWAWHADHVQLSVTIRQPFGVIVAVIGGQTLRVAALPVIGITAGHLSIVAEAPAADGARSFRLRGERISVTVPDLDQMGLDQMGPDQKGPDQGLSAARLDGHAVYAPAAEPNQPAITFAAEAADLRLPSGIRWPLGSRVAAVAVEGAVTGPLPPRRPAAGSLISELASWRDGGGTVHLRRAALNWGKLSLSGAATLGLDDRLQPMGTGTVRLAGYAATLDALAAAGVLTRSAAIAATAVLSLLGGTQDGDAEVPLTLRSRTVSMRQVPLLRLPEVIWPGW